MIEQVIGRFHPLIVHLPIGFLSMAIFLKLVSVYKYKDEITKLFPLILGLSFLSLLLACITGYVQHINQGYEDVLVHNHMYLALSLTSIMGLLWMNPSSKWISNSLWILAALTLLLTGHFGGSLTHGEDYLTANASHDAPLQKVKIDTTTALIYQDIVKPILDEKCVSCHSSKKQKGKLRLDNLDFINKGGENGSLFVLDQTKEALIYKRIHLAMNDEKHMPPKGKPQLTSDEKKLLIWWMESGPGKDNKITVLSKSNEVQAILKILSEDKPLEVKRPAIEPLQTSIIDFAKKNEWVLTPVGQNENYYTLNLSFKKQISSGELAQLNKLSNSIIKLNANGLTNTDSLMSILINFKNLTTLHLDNSDVSNGALRHLSSLDQLAYINLSNTDVAEEGITHLSKIISLKKLYLFNTKVDKTKWKNIEKMFPHTTVDSGGYIVPIYHADTSRLKT